MTFSVIIKVYDCTPSFNDLNLKLMEFSKKLVLRCGQLCSHEDLTIVDHTCDTTGWNGGHLNIPLLVVTKT